MTGSPDFCTPRCLKNAPIILTAILLVSCGFQTSPDETTQQGGDIFDTHEFCLYNIKFENASRLSSQDFPLFTLPENATLCSWRPDGFSYFLRDAFPDCPEALSLKSNFKHKIDVVGATSSKTSECHSPWLYSGDANDATLYVDIPKVTDRQAYREIAITLEAAEVDQAAALSEIVSRLTLSGVPISVGYRKDARSWSLHYPLENFPWDDRLCTFIRALEEIEAPQTSCTINP